MIRLSVALSLPIAFVTQTAAIIARKGGGKTYVATKLAEQMLAADAQVIVCDPVGNWYGLRLKADGKTESGLPVYIFGGEYADVPITVDSGREIARLLATKPISAVLDVSRFRKGERERFMTAFAEEFFHLKKTHRSPVHLFIEEAQVFVPQMTQGRGPEAAKMLGAFEDIVRLGRNYGVGATMISQRPQSVNKQVLSQTECLIALQITGPHERKAIDEWVTEHGVDRKLVGELPSLQQGEAFFWSPGWLRQFLRIKIERKLTYDASSTPEAGAKLVKPVQLSPKEIAELGTALQQSVEKAKAEDPRELRKEIADLKRELAKKTPVAAPVIDKAAIEKAVSDAIAKTRRDIEKAYAPLVKMVTAFAEKVSGAIPAAIEYTPVDEVFKEVQVSALRPTVQRFERMATLSVKAEGNGHTAIGESGLRRMMIALAQRNGLNARQLGVRAGMSSSSGTFGTYLAKGRTNGWLDGSRDRLVITDAGLAALGSYDPLPTGRELLNYWLRQLGDSGAGRMLSVLADAYPKALSKAELGERASISHSSGTFGTYLSKLRTLELIEGKGELRASEEFFQ